MRCGVILSKGIAQFTTFSILCAMLAVCSGGRSTAQADSVNPCMNVDIYARASAAALNMAAAVHANGASSRTRKLKYVAAAISEYGKLNTALGDLPNAASSDAPLCENMLNLRYWEMLDYWAKVSVADAISDNLTTIHDGECRRYLNLQAQTLVAEGFAFINQDEGDTPLRDQISSPYAANGYPGHNDDVDSFQRTITLAASKLKMVLPDGAEAESYLEQKKQDREMAAVALDQECEHQSKMPLALLVVIFPRQ